LKQKIIKLKNLKTNKMKKLLLLCGIFILFLNGNIFAQSNGQQANPVNGVPDTTKPVVNANTSATDIQKVQQANPAPKVGADGKPVGSENKTPALVQKEQNVTPVNQVPNITNPKDVKTKEQLQITTGQSPEIMQQIERDLKNNPVNQAAGDKDKK
jgi:hypothetical protein